jgi:ankyrin repeat protein
MILLFNLFLFSHLTFAQTPLFEAIFNFQTKEAIRLIDEGADIETRNAKGRTPLLESLNEDLEKVAIHLINKGADLTVQDQNGLAAIHWSIKTYETQVRRLLMTKNIDINIADNKGWTPLIYAADYMDDWAVNEILKLNPDINHRDHQGRTALMLADFWHDNGIMEVLLNHGALPYSFDGQNFKLDIELWGEMHKAFYGYEDQMGNNHLMMAIQDKNFKLVEHLMKLDFPFDNQNHLGETALIHLVKAEEFQIIKILVEEKNIYLNARDNFGHTALFYAKNNFDIFEYLKSHGSFE